MKIVIIIVDYCVSLGEWNTIIEHLSRINLYGIFLILLILRFSGEYESCEPVSLADL